MHGDIMNKQNSSLPKRYWLYLIICAILGVLLFVNIFATDGLTGDKGFRDFARRDWLYFALFIGSELILILLMFVFSVKSGKLYGIYQKQTEEHFAQYKYAGIDPGDYTYVWFDFSGIERAKISQRDNCFYLHVDDFDEKSCTWSALGTVSVHSSMDEIKKYLFDECDFFCDANAILDKHGNEIYKDTRE